MNIAIAASNISLIGPEGPVYGPLNLTIPDKGLTIIRNPAGGGNTALALTLSGRMKPTTGTVTAFSTTKRARIRKFIKIAGTKEIDPLDRDVKLHTVIGEYRNWNRHWWQPIARASESYYEQLLQPVYGDRELPPLNEYVSHNSELDQLLLRISMALGRPHTRMLLVDDLEQIRSITERETLIAMLEELGRTIPVLAFAVNPTDSKEIIL